MTTPTLKKYLPQMGLSLKRGRATELRIVGRRDRRLRSGVPIPKAQTISWNDLVPRMPAAIVLGYNRESR